MPATVGQTTAALVFDAAKTCVDIRIMRLEPIAKRSPKHARGSPGRCPFHDVVPVDEEISRVARIKRKRLKTWKGGEDRARPLPSVAEEAGHAKGAGSCRECRHRRRIPAQEIEITVIRLG